MCRLAGLLALLALVLAGCGGTTSDVGAGASDFVPGSAAVFIAVDTDPSSSQWQTVDELASKFPDKQKGIDAIKREMREDKVDWEKDVNPALGDELDFVWLDFGNNGENFVILTQPSEETAFKRLIKKANASEEDPADRVLYEKFQGWYVLAAKRSTIDRFEHASESATSTLSNERAFKQSMHRLGGDSIVRAYASGKVLMQLARRYATSDVRPYLNRAGTLDWIALRLGATSDGVGLDAIVHGTPGELFKGLKLGSSFEANLTRSVPRNALVYWTFHGSKGMFTSLGKNKLFKSPEFREFRDVFKDLDTLLQGENALYVRPGKKIPEVTFVASPAKDEDGALIVDRLLERKAQVVPERETIAGVNARKLASDGLGLYYGNVHGRLVVTDMPAGIRSFKDPGKSLSDSDEYSAAADASGLPGKTHGFLYVDIHSTVPLVEKLSQQSVPAEIGRNLKPLRSAVEYAVSRSHELQISFFLRIK